MIGEWSPPDTAEVNGPPAPNPIVGHVINRLFNMVHPPSVSVKLEFVSFLNHFQCIVLDHSTCLSD